MLILTFAARGAEVSLGAFVGAHIAEGQHELYEAREKPHGPLGVAFPVGGRLGLQLFGPVHLEGEGSIGPATRVGGGFLYGLRGQVTLMGPRDWRVRPLASVGFGNLGVRTDKLGNDVDLAAHAGLGAVVPFNDVVGLRADARWMPSARAGRGGIGHHAQVLVGLHLTPWIQRARDADRDGILDADDGCPQEPEVENAYLDQDGCPDALADITLRAHDSEGPLAGATVTEGSTEVGVTDADGTWTRTGQIPGAPLGLVVTAEGHEPATIDTMLTEGANTLDVELPWAPGTVELAATGPDGSPVSAAVSTGTSSMTLGPDGALRTQLDPGIRELVFTADGFETLRHPIDLGARAPGLTRVAVVMQPDRPAPAPQVEVQRDSLVTLDPILFDAGTHTIRADSLHVVDAVAQSLIAHPEIKRIEVGGHASAEGSDAFNLALSKERMREVVRRLVAKGVAAERLTSRGYGEATPVASNESEAGRRKNRRVAFTILEREP